MSEKINLVNTLVSLSHLRELLLKLQQRGLECRELEI